MKIKNNRHQRLFTTLKNKPAIIWDFDGVIIFTNWNYPPGRDYWRTKRFELFKSFDPEILAKIPDSMDYPFQHSDYLIKTLGLEVAQKINQHYLDRELSIVPDCQLNQPVVEAMAGLDDKVEQYIWSNNQFGFIETMLKDTPIWDKFSEVVSLDRSLLAKPNLDGFDLIKAKTQHQPQDFLFVGDSLNTDAIVARKLGMDFFHYA